MNHILLFAGTSEGRELAEFLERQGISCDICVATEYGETLLDETTTIHRLHTGRLTKEEMISLMKAQDISLVIDATHPYARVVSKNIHAACGETGCKYYRLLRETELDCASVHYRLLSEKETDRTSLFDGLPAETETDRTNLCDGLPTETGLDYNSVIIVDSVDEAVEYLAGTTGGILAATGSKELAKYTRIPDYRERVYARVLSTLEAVETCTALGFQGKHLICMQGPFSEEMNYAMLKQTGARFLVTKESGQTGGFPEKVRAARRAGVRLVVVDRPGEVYGVSPENQEQLWKNSPEIGYSSREIRKILAKELLTTWKRRIALIGIGMGNPANMTLEARRICEEADVLIGAQRMLACAEDVMVPKFAEYLPEKIKDFLDEHREYEKAAILLSGDTGFYSGAKKLLEQFEKEQVQVIPGISSVSYLCAKLQMCWEDIRLVSIHGRTQNLIAAVRSNPKVFTLVGKQESFRDMCRELIEYGFSDIKLSAGCRLSYEDERILRGTPGQLLEEEVGDLTAVLIENENPSAVITHGMDDACFLRDKVPMTKSEVRSISLSKLKLERNSCIFDVGAGTGSVAIELALQAAEGMVYAIEKKPEAVELIRKNQKKFGVTNLEVIEGCAPEALEELPAPTHAFIGGSSGSLMEILQLLRKKNPGMRIVINAITLETVAEALRCIRELPSTDPDIVSVSVAKAKQAGEYHMMMGQNPVYIISFQFADEMETEK